MKLLNLIDMLLFPPKCLLCNQVLEPREMDLCRSCRAQAPECLDNRKNFSFLDGWCSVWYYEGKAAESLRRFKFLKCRHYAPGYGRLMAQRVSQYLEGQFDCMTFVPTGSRRKRTRGFDQTELLAQALGQELGLTPVRLLKKVRETPPQSRINDPAARKANVLEAYAITGDAAGKRVLLIDDILTTGATAGECARTLLTAGASHVYLATVAMARGKEKQVTK